MKIRIFLVFIAQFLAFPSLSQGTHATALNEKELASVLRYYQGIKSLEVSFTQIKKMRSLDLSLTSSGILKVEHSPQKIIWQILKPAPTTVTLSGNEMKVVNDPGKPTEETQVLKLDALPKTNPADHAESQNFASLSAWLNLDAHTLSHDYSAKKVSDATYEFIPNEKDKTPFEKLEITLHPGGPLEKLVIHELSQDEIEIRFGKPKP